jgi:hypothetical protein
MGNANWIPFKKSKESCWACGRVGSQCSVSKDGTVVCCWHDQVGAFKTKTAKNGDVCYFHSYGDIERKKAPRALVQDIPERPRAEDSILNQAYRMIQSESSLSTVHERYFRYNRQWKEAEYEAPGYFTPPPEGRRYKIAKKIAETFGEDLAARIPGMMKQAPREGMEPQWALRAWDNSFWIPVRNLKEEIVAYRVRIDDEVKGVGKSARTVERTKLNSRYRWVSTSDQREAGASPGTPVHVPLGKRTKTVRITEGELKADLATMRTKILTLGVPGVGGWERAIPILEELKPERILLAYDMDAKSNVFVARPLKAMFEGFSKIAPVAVEVWNARYKGIDDALVAKEPIKVLEGEAAAKYIEETLAAASAIQRKREVGKLDQSPLPELPEGVAGILKDFLPMLVQAWLTDPDDSMGLVNGISAALAQRGVEPEFVGRIVLEIALAAGERNCEAFGWAARACAKANKNQPIGGVMSSLRLVGLNFRNNFLAFAKKLEALLVPDQWNAKEAFDNWDTYCEEAKSGKKKSRKPRQPGDAPLELKTYKDWVPIITEDIGKSLRRRMTGTQVDSYGTDPERRRPLKEYFTCSSIARFLLHDGSGEPDCDRREFDGLRNCHMVTCYTCRSQQVFLAVQYNKSPSYGNWPKRICVAESQIFREGDDLFPTKEQIAVEMAFFTARLKQMRHKDTCPRTIVGTDRLYHFMAIDPLLSETEMVKEIELAGRQNVRVLDQEEALQIFEMAALSVAKAIDKLVDDTALNLLWSPDEIERQECQQKMKYIIKQVDRSLKRHFILGGRTPRTLTSGFGSYQQKVSRQKYNSDTGELDPTLEIPHKSKAGLVFEDGCRCKATAFADAHFASVHVTLPGHDDTEETATEMQRLAIKSGQSEMLLEPYCTPAAMLRSDEAHLEAFGQETNDWNKAPPDPQLVGAAS